jgi:hypothetical protein
VTNTTSVLVDRTVDCDEVSVSVFVSLGGCVVLIGVWDGAGVVWADGEGEGVGVVSMGSELDGEGEGVFSEGDGEGDGVGVVTCGDEEGVAAGVELVGSRFEALGNVTESPDSPEVSALFAIAWPL